MAHSSADIVVIGAGVLGLATAAELGARGHDVTVVDPGGPNASSVAAGMIAPASEALLDGWETSGAADHGALFARARDCFQQFAERHGLTVHREGAAWAGGDPAAVYHGWRRWGFEPSTEPWPRTMADWRIDAEAALERLRTASGLRLRQDQAVSVFANDGAWMIELAVAAPMSARQVVVATGAVTALNGPLPLQAALGLVTPIRGQLGFIPRRLVDQAVRAEDVYLVPAEGGTIVGATMEPGRTDLAPDEEAGVDLARRALSLIGETPPDGIRWRVGIRGATPDGLPMAGTVAPGLHVALAPRRNGWLMSAFVARVVADAVEGRARADDAAALDPSRFSLPAG